MSTIRTKSDLKKAVDEIVTIHNGHLAYENLSKQVRHYLAGLGEHVDSVAIIRTDGTIIVVEGFTHAVEDLSVTIPDLVIDARNMECNDHV